MNQLTAEDLLDKADALVKACEELRQTVHEIVADFTSAHCIKCGTALLGDIDSICGQCAG